MTFYIVDYGGGGEGKGSSIIVVNCLQHAAQTLGRSKMLLYDGLGRIGSRCASKFHLVCAPIYVELWPSCLVYYRKCCNEIHKVMIPQFVICLLLL